MTRNNNENCRSIEDHLVIGELIYNSNPIWKALVTEYKAAGEQDKYQLWIQIGNDNPIRSGLFTHAKALVKYVKEAAITKFPTANPVFDSVSRLATLNRSNVVPLCFSDSDKQYSVKCEKCPYKEECQRTPEPEPGIAETTEESDSDFLKRLQKKLLTTKWD